ncbi:MAG: flippase [Muribaculaceae bacterium]|nr:flippase [Muribaculaceae bacterium]
MTAIRKNIILNGINTVSGIVFPIITFPYAARVLMPDGIGAVNFLNSIISYIVLLTSLGIPMYAVKEVAKCRDNVALRNRVTVEIIILSSLLCVAGYVAVWLLAAFVPEIHQQAALFYVLSLSIVFNAIGVNWFYQAVEDFKFITVRAIVVRALAALSLFLFVHDESDLLIYGFITVGSTVGNNIINFVHLRKHVSLPSIDFKELRIWRHLTPAFQVFILNLIISLYIQLNSVMLGFMSGDEAVGYFTAGTKISHIGLTMIGSIGTVLLPRCANLLKSGDMEAFTSVIHKSLRLTLGLSLPLTAGLMLLAAPVTYVFCGDEYTAAIPVLLLNAPVVVFISLTNIMGIQILYPMDKIRIVIWSVTGGAVANLLFNFALIPLWGATGAAVSTLIAEFAVLVIQIVAGRRYYPFGIRDLFQWRYILSTVIMSAVVFIATLPVDDNWLKLAVGVPVGIVTYYISLYLMHDSLIVDMLSINKLKKT